MIDCQMIPDTNVLEMSIDGYITAAEFADLLKLMDEQFKQHSKLRLLIKVLNLTGFEPTLIFHDVLFGIRHFFDLSHYAIATDQIWVKRGIIASRLFMLGQIQIYGMDELDQARQWILPMIDASPP
ncbi:MAG: STAS/SEC14 domain-containing protein [Thermosynechococcaceae cyanobacterium]